MLLERIGDAAMLEQTAEECSELAHACLKYARMLRGENPADMLKSTAMDNVVEEMADVMICLDELTGIDVLSMHEVGKWMDFKERRMKERFGE